jgi:citrate lyase subunit beta / citryl-CoA lyase
MNRSYLFVPANRPERIAKALASGTHAVIVDLEDAVPPGEKMAAREALAAALPAAQPVLVRINSAGTEWYRDDLALLASPGIAGVVLAKAERVHHIAEVTQALGADARVIPLIETAQGFANALELARAPSVLRLLFGSLDFQLDLGIDGEGDELLHFRSQLVLVSRLAGIEPPIDGVYTAFDDDAGLRAETLRVRKLGFGAKCGIHPRQVGVINDSFRPTADEVAWAKRVVQAAADAQGAAVALDGRMVDTPVIAKAEQILKDAQH